MIAAAKLFIELNWYEAGGVLALSVIAGKFGAWLLAAMGQGLLERDSAQAPQREASS